MKLLKTIFPILFAIVLALGCSKEPTKPDTELEPPTFYEPNAAAVINGKLYVIHDFEHLRVYDPASNHWTSKAPMPSPRGVAAAGVIDGKLYVAGGIAGGSYSGFLLVYDPVSNTWVDKAPMPTARRWAAGGVIGGEFYVAGGYNPELNPCHLSVLEVYNAITDSWTQRAPMPTARSFAAAEVIDSKLYMVGGIRDAEDNLEVYDPISDTWTSKSPIQTARSHHAAGVIDKKLYVAGGTHSCYEDPRLGSVPVSARSIEVYDPAIDTWTQVASIDKAIIHAVAGVIDHKMIIFGMEYIYFDEVGLDLTLNTLEIYSP